MRARRALIEGLACVVFLGFLVGGPGPAAAGTRVALAPISTLGEESRTRATQRVESLLEKALAEVEGFEVVSQKELDRKTRRAKRRDLRACDGDAACLAQLGELLNAKVVVYGEIGGLGDAQVVYLEAVDTAARKEARSTVLELGASSDAERAARSAAYRLLAPDRYRGRLAPKVDVEGATIFVNGKAAGTSPTGPIDLSVGTHAVRITHPEYRDFVRFVDIEFDETSEVEVELTQYPIVARDLASNKKKNVAGPDVIYRGQATLPWYREWYTVAAGGTLLLVGSAVLIGVLADGLDFDDERTIDPPR